MTDLTTLDAIADAIVAGLQSPARPRREAPLSAEDLARLAEAGMAKCGTGMRGITTVSADETWAMAAVLSMTGGVRRLRAALAQATFQGAGKAPGEPSVERPVEAPAKGALQ